MLNRCKTLTVNAWLSTLALLLVVSGAIAQTRSAVSRSETYKSATIDAGGELAITKENGEIIVIPKEAEQTSFSTPKLSEARTAVGAQAMFKNCCTSYDIPLQLVVYAGGKVHRFKGLPIFLWGFADAGSRIAYSQETVHGSCFTHYELRNIDSERLIEQIDVPQPCGLDSDPKPVKLPQWVADLIAKG